MTQCASSQFLLGRVKVPVKVPDAEIATVSPQFAESIAACRSPPALTVIVLPVCYFFFWCVLQLSTNLSCAQKQLLFTPAPTGNLGLLSNMTPSAC